jgi:hypothetical protein
VPSPPFVVQPTKVLQAEAGIRPDRLLLKRNMLKDHLLSSYQSALEAALQNSQVVANPLFGR